MICGALFAPFADLLRQISARGLCRGGMSGTDTTIPPDTTAKLYRYKLDFGMCENMSD